MPENFYTPAEGISDRSAFRAMLARLGIDSRIVTDAFGRDEVALDRAGMEKLAAWFAERGDTAQAEAIQRALDAERGQP